MSAERWYRLLLSAYPDGHREELLGTLIEAGGSRRRPSARESVALLRGAFAAHARRRAARSVPWWVDGLHLGVLGLVVAALSDVVWESSARPVVYAMLVLAVLRGRFRVALPIAVFAAVQNDLGVLPWMRVESTDWRFGASLWLAAAVLFVLAIPGSRGRQPRAWWWLVIPAAAVFDWLSLAVAPHELQAFAEIGLLVAGLCATVAVPDLRWLLASAVYLLPAAYGNLDNPAIRLHSAGNVAYHGILAVLLLATAMAARHARRRV